jgi:hypothetical protein
MASTLFETDVYIRFADEPMAFIYTVRYGGFALKSARVPISNSGPQSAPVDGPVYDVSNAVKQALRKPAPDSSDRAG